MGREQEGGEGGKKEGKGEDGDMMDRITWIYKFLLDNFLKLLNLKIKASKKHYKLKFLFHSLLFGLE